MIASTCPILTYIHFPPAHYPTHDCTHYHTDLHGLPEHKGIVLLWSHQQGQHHILKVTTQLTLQLTNQILQQRNKKEAVT